MLISRSVLVSSKSSGVDFACRGTRWAWLILVRVFLCFLVYIHYECTHSLLMDSAPRGVARPTSTMTSSSQEPLNQDLPSVVMCDVRVPKQTR